MEYGKILTRKTLNTVTLHEMMGLHELCWFIQFLDLFYFQNVFLGKHGKFDNITKPSCQKFPSKIW